MQNFGRVKVWRIDHFLEFVGEFTIANISYFSEWLGKILVNGICFVKFIKVFPYQNLALYGLNT